MMAYMLELVYYFAIYSLGGWLLENVYSRITAGVFWKDGFLSGPFKPMYGFSMLILIVLMNAGLPVWGLALMCLVVPTAIEYMSGLWLDKWLQHKYWDYSAHRCQMEGYICLRFSLYWFVLTSLTLAYLQPHVGVLYLRLLPMWQDMLPWFLIYLVTDVGLTVWLRRLKLSKPSIPEGTL